MHVGVVVPFLVAVAVVAAVAVAVAVDDVAERDLDYRRY
jgi:hypothetical protein